MPLGTEEGRRSISVHLSICVYRGVCQFGGASGTDTRSSLYGHLLSELEMGCTITPLRDRAPRKEPSLSTIMSGAFTALLPLVLDPVLVTQWSLPAHLPSHLLSLIRSEVPGEGPFKSHPACLIPSSVS